MQKYHNINGLRFLFCIIIVLFHISSNISKYLPEDLFMDYHRILHNTGNSYVIVEFFFIIAGFFLYKTYKKYTTLEFIYKKIARLWPVLAFSIILTVLLALLGFVRTNYYTQFINLFFLQCVGVTIDFKGINWYVSSYFWAIIFYFYILKNYKRHVANTIIRFCTYFSLVGLINNFNGNFAREVFNIFFCGGVLRALASIGIGYFIALIHEKCFVFLENSPNTKKTYITASLVEFMCLFFIIYHFIFHRIHYSNKLIFVIVFSILLLCFIVKKGFFSNIFNKPVFSFLGNFSYSIYVMQQVGFYLLSITLWKISFITLNPYLCIILTILFCTLLGILTYYIIEKNAYNYFIAQTNKAQTLTAVERE